MNAAVLHELGKPPRCEAFPDPVAGEGEVVVDVLAAALKPVDKQLASGAHYAAPQQLPMVCGTDGVGRLADGQRVFFGGCRSPYGAMAQRTVVPKAFTFDVPDELDDAAAAALPNPGVSAWLSLAYRAKLMPGDSVLILGATGIAGRLAVKIAKILGAARVVAAGRNPEALRSLLDQGADATLRLDLPATELRSAFAKAAGSSGFQAVIDFVWGEPAEQFFAATARKEFAVIGGDIRYVQVGESAGSKISLPAAVLRSAPINILGTGGIPPYDILTQALRDVLAHAARGDLQVETETVPLTQIEQAWHFNYRRRLVVAP
ncbi:MAG: zinc-binding alcohol dehydrogenase family protein [Acidobacteria bacterium]|nr:MAG: zinc-binding alcohol dehydrogenase family protein [Acidobacteriota bacterium]